MLDFLKIKWFFKYFLIVFLVILGVFIFLTPNFAFDSKINLEKSLSKNIFLDSKKLDKDIFIYNSSIDLKNYKLQNSCLKSQKFLWKKWNNYYFEASFLDICFDNNLFLVSESWKKIPNLKVKLNLFSDYKIFNIFSDLKTSDLEKIKKSFEENIEKYNSKWIKTFKDLQNLRKKNEDKYMLNILNNILKLREQKYLLPIDWVWLSKNLSKIPNSPRPYRKEYTDWIHHWWDFDAEYGQKIRAIDTWIIVRVVRDFKFSDLNKIKRKNLLYEDKLKNLDLLRWNQVWLKTAKWDVVFYSHLSKIADNIRVWTFVKKWDFIWNVWISWVPDKNYKDYHLHLAIQKNPYIVVKAWKWTLDEYLKWPWYFKWKSQKFVLENQDKVFSN